MDFPCCSERWTCPSRPWFPLLNLHHIAHLGCFCSLWPKWNYLLLKPRLGKEPTCGLNFHFLSGNVDFLWRGSEKKTRHSAGWLDSAFNVLTVFIHKMSQGGSTAACAPALNTFNGALWQYADLNDELPKKEHRKEKNMNTGLQI